MLNKTAIILLCVFLLCGCRSREKSPTVIKMGNIEISSHEFEKAYKDSPYSIEDSPRSRKEFLDIYLMRMAILKEAEHTGADKDPEFLKSVQSFWQQALVKMMLDREIKKASSKISVTDAEVTNYYQTHKAQFMDKELPAVYSNIKWLLVNKKQKEAMAEWLNSIKKNSKVDIDYKLLKIDK
jgi:hypothetical protein